MLGYVFSLKPSPVISTPIRVEFNIKHQTIPSVILHADVFVQLPNSDINPSTKIWSKGATSKVYDETHQKQCLYSLFMIGDSDGNINYAILNENNVITTNSFKAHNSPIVAILSTGDPVRPLWRVGTTVKGFNEEGNVCPIAIPGSALITIGSDGEVKTWQPQFANQEFVCNADGKVLVKREVDKMSKRWYNVVTPDDLCEKYGADTLRMYEMFLGPLEQSKPWDTKGITGVHGFLKKYWRLFHLNGQFEVEDNPPSPAALKTLHKTIKKLTDDLERFSFNTGVSSFMICVNELTEQKCNNRHILEQLTMLMAPYAPHICEEIWAQLRPASSTIFTTEYPIFDPSYLTESTFDYPVSFNGKMRYKATLDLSLSMEEVKVHILDKPETQKWLEGKMPKKVIVVHGKIVNIVL